MGNFAPVPCVRGQSAGSPRRHHPRIERSTLPRRIPQTAPRPCASRPAPRCTHMPRREQRAATIRLTVRRGQDVGQRQHHRGSSHGVADQRQARTTVGTERPTRTAYLATRVDTGTAAQPWHATGRHRVVKMFCMACVHIALAGTLLRRAGTCGNLGNACEEGYRGRTDRLVRRRDEGARARARVVVLGSSPRVCSGGGRAVRV